MAATVLRTCLERLLLEAARQKDVRDAVSVALESYSDEEDTVKFAGGDVDAISADTYWAPFKLACHISQPSKLREAALGCLQKLIAHQVLRGALPLPAASPASLATASPLPRPSSASSPAGIENDLANLDTSAPAPAPTSPDGPTSPPSAGIVITPRSSSLVPDATQPTATPQPAFPPTPFLIDEIIHTVCVSFVPTQVDESVQLQVLKVLLTAVTSTACEVHEVSLLKVVQTCANIHLVSKTQTNQMTAKASLTQMVNLIFTKMERYTEVMASSAEAGGGDEEEKASVVDAVRRSGEEGSAEGPDTTVIVDGSLDGESAPGSAEGTAEAAVAGGANEEKAVESESQVEPVVAETEPVADVESVADAQPAIDTDPAAQPATETEASPAISDESVAPAPEPATYSDLSVPAAPPKHIPVRSMFDDDDGLASPPAEAASDVEELEPAGEPNGHPTSPPAAAAPDAPAAPPPPRLMPPTAPPGNNPYDPTISYYNQLLRKDVFLVFRLLCRLSVQTDTPTPSTASTTFNAASVTAAASQPMDEISQHATKARTLALELILSVLTNSGPVLQTDDLYIGLVKQNLCLSISRNGIATNPMLFELSLSIFLMVIRFYRAKLKSEVEVLLNTIYLHILEMPNSTYKQKSMMLQGLLKICENPQ
ncbi:guanine nucleotide exchange factor in Golgi transport N-terminal-domain-containing protein, partial [Blyttiomyces helicus]